MKQNISHRIHAFFLALLMLLSSTGFSMDIHYCQGNIAGISLLGKADCCTSNMQASSCHSKKSNFNVEIKNPKKDNCCHNESIVIEKSDIDAPVAQISSKLDFQLSLNIPYNHTNSQFKTAISCSRSTFALYKPPLPDRDIQVLFQTFLI